MVNWYKMHVQIRYLSHNESPYIASYGDYMTRERLMNDKVTYLSNKVHSVFLIFEIEVFVTTDTALWRVIWNWTIYFDSIMSCCSFFLASQEQNCFFGLSLQTLQKNVLPECVRNCNWRLPFLSITLHLKISCPSSPALPMGRGMACPVPQVKIEMESDDDSDMDHQRPRDMSSETTLWSGCSTSARSEIVQLIPDKTKTLLNQWVFHKFIELVITYWKI